MAERKSEIEGVYSPIEEDILVAPPESGKGPLMIILGLKERDEGDIESLFLFFQDKRKAVNYFQKVANKISNTVSSS